MQLKRPLKLLERSWFLPFLSVVLDQGKPSTPGLPVGVDAIEQDAVRGFLGPEIVPCRETISVPEVRFDHPQHPAVGDPGVVVLDFVAWFHDVHKLIAKAFYEFQQCSIFLFKSV